MANTFKLKRSSVQNKVPTTSDLDLGELGWNSYDGKLYGKKDDGTVAIVEIGASSGGIASVVADTSPQLGGNLDANSKNIQLGYSTNHSDDRLKFDSNNMQIYYGAVGSGSTGVICTEELGIYRTNNANPGVADSSFLFNVSSCTLSIYGNTWNGSTNGSIYLYYHDRTKFIGIVPPYSSSLSTYTLTLPTSAGSSGQVLTTNGYGDLSWSTPASTSSFIDTSNTSQTKQGRLTLGSTGANNEGLSILHTKSSSGYGSIRAQDGSTSSSDNNNTILFFSNDWGGSSAGVEDSQGCINIWGSYGVTFGTYNLPDAYISNNVFAVRGDENGTRGSIKLFKDDNNYAVTLAPNSNLASNFTITLPTGTGSNGQVLTTDGSGVTSWTTVSGGSGGISNVVEDTTPQLGGALDTNGKNITFGDSGSGSDDRLTFGAGTDMQIYHDGLNSYIHENTSGHIRICSDHTNFWDNTKSTEYASIANAALTVYGDGSATQGRCILKCENNSHSVVIQAPAHANFSSSWDFTLPGSAGTSGQVLTTNGSGVCSWTTVSGGGSAGGSSAITMNDNTNINFGTNSDVEMFYNGINMHMDLNSPANLLIRDGTTTRFTLTRNTGDFTASGNVTAFSDERLKTDIQPIGDAKKKLSKIRGVTFIRKDIEGSTRSAGVIAQEVEKVLPEVVTSDEKGIKSVAYGNLVGLLIEAIKEQQAEIDELKAYIYDRGK